MAGLSAKQRLELDACTRCGECLKICETYTGEELTAPYLKLKAYNSYAKGEGMHPLLARLFGARKPSPQEIQALSQGIYQCTVCARCAAVCPAKINLLDLWISLREDMVGRGHYPANLNMARDAVVNEHNVVAYPNDERATWVDFMAEAPDDLYQREKAEWVYFVGCIASFSPAVQSIPEAFVQLLTKAGVDFTLLGNDEWCCSFPLIVAGMRDAAADVQKHNIEMIKQKGAKGVVFTCPSCYKTWNAEYRSRLPGVELLHSTQFIERLLKQGIIKFNGLGKTVTYHDPCDLGRNSGVFETPRRVIRSVPGLTLVESAQHGERSHCCGGGGDLEIYMPELAGSIAARTLGAFKETGAEVLITACQQCKRSFLSAEAKSGTGLEILDISELALRLMAEPQREA